MLRRCAVLAVVVYVLMMLVGVHSQSLSVPRTWDEKAVADLEVPLANAEVFRAARQ